MSIESLVDTYGYLAVLIGTFLEGETVLVLGGFAAHRGYLTLQGVVLAAFIGSFCGDQLFFFLGRRHSHTILAKRPSWKARLDKAKNLLERFGRPFILAFRFLYGLRTVAPFMIGMSSIPALKFVLLSAVSAFVWAGGVGVAGYFFGHALEIAIGDVKHYEVHIFGMIAVIGVLIWGLHFYRRRKSNRSPLSGKAV